MVIDNGYCATRNLSEPDCRIIDTPQIPSRINWDSDIDIKIQYLTVKLKFIDGLSPD